MKISRTNQHPTRPQVTNELLESMSDGPYRKKLIARLEAAASARERAQEKLDRDDLAKRIAIETVLFQRESASAPEATPQADPFEERKQREDMALEKLKAAKSPEEIESAKNEIRAAIRGEQSSEPTEESQSG